MGRAIRILLVDDDHFVRKLVQQQLTAQGYEVQAENNAADALAALESRSFDLLITDIVMPGRDGCKLIRALRGAGHTLPVIAMTGGVENAVGDCASYAEMFADLTLIKPIPQADLIEAVKGTLGGA